MGVEVEQGRLLKRREVEHVSGGCTSCQRKRRGRIVNISVKHHRDGEKKFQTVVTRWED